VEICITTSGSLTRFFRQVCRFAEVFPIINVSAHIRLKASVDKAVKQSFLAYIVKGMFFLLLTEEKSYP
jgi:hypothetical protein